MSARFPAVQHEASWNSYLSMPQKSMLLTRETNKTQTTCEPSVSSGFVKQIDKIRRYHAQFIQSGLAHQVPGHRSSSSMNQQTTAPSGQASRIPNSAYRQNYSAMNLDSARSMEKSYSTGKKAPERSGVGASSDGKKLVKKAPSRSGLVKKQAQVNRIPGEIRGKVGSPNRDLLKFRVQFEPEAQSQQQASVFDL